jgi:hypothetical protein
MNTTVVVSGEGLGRGSDELGRTLMGNFLRKLWAAEPRPSAVIFYHAGVKLLAAGSPALDALDGLAGADGGRPDQRHAGDCRAVDGVGPRNHGMTA